MPVRIALAIRAALRAWPIALLMATATFATGLWSPAASLAATYGPYRMSFGNIRDLSITVVDEVGVIAPQMQNFDRVASAEQVRPLGLGETQATFAQLLAQTGAGAAAPYFLSSTVNALDNIDRHLVSGAGRIFGPLVPANLRTGGRLTLRLFASREAFAAWLSQSVATHGADAAYDPRSNTIGMFVDRRFLLNFGYQAGWSGYPQAYFVRELRLYVDQLFARTVSHEVVHFLQSQSDSRLYAFSAFREGVAIAIAGELEARHEVLMLVTDMTASGRDPNDLSATGARGDRCEELRFRGGLLNFFQADNFVVARDLVRQSPQFSITDFILRSADRRSFYAGREEELEAKYAISFAAVQFLLVLDEQRLAAWREIAAANPDATSPPGMQQRKASLDEEFRAYVVHRMDAAQMVAQAGVASVDEARRKLTSCLDVSAPMALFWGHFANMIEPGDPYTAVQVGDVFADSDFPTGDGQMSEGHSLAALDYYRLALARLGRGRAGISCPPTGTPETPREYLLVHARLGERYSEIGDIAQATRHLRCVIGVAAPIFRTDPDLTLTLLPTLLNAEIRLRAYSLATAAGLERTRAVSELIRTRNAETARMLLRYMVDPDRQGGPGRLATTVCVAQLLSLSIIDGEIRRLQQELAPTRPLPQPDISLCGLSISQGNPVANGT